MVTVPSLSTRAHSWESRYFRLLGMEDMTGVLSERLGK
jgi:hypothetical protein